MFGIDYSKHVMRFEKAEVRLLIDYRVLVA